MGQSGPAPLHQRGPARGGRGRRGDVARAPFSACPSDGGGGSKSSTAPCLCGRSAFDGGDMEVEVEGEGGGPSTLPQPTLLLVFLIPL